MNTITRLLFAPLVACIMLASATAALAQPTPLVVIRFNQPRVYYSQPLYNAIAKAVAIKPDVVFDVISYAPVTADSDVNEAWKETASRNTRGVVANLQKMGVPLERIHVTGQPMNGIKYDETHVFVR